MHWRIQPQDPATLTHAQEAVATETPVKMGPIQNAIVMKVTSGPAPTNSGSNTSVPTARSCVDYAVAVIHHHFLLTVSGVHGNGEHAL